MNRVHHEGALHTQSTAVTAVNSLHFAIDQTYEKTRERIMVIDCLGGIENRLDYRKRQRRHPGDRSLRLCNLGSPSHRTFS